MTTVCAVFPRESAVAPQTTREHRISLLSMINGKKYTTEQRNSVTACQRHRTQSHGEQI